MISGSVPRTLPGRAIKWASLLVLGICNLALCSACRHGVEAKVTQKCGKSKILSTWRLLCFQVCGFLSRRRAVLPPFAQDASVIQLRLVGIHLHRRVLVAGGARCGQSTNNVVTYSPSIQTRLIFFKVNV